MNTKIDLGVVHPVATFLCYGKIWAEREERVELHDPHSGEKIGSHQLPIDYYISKIFDTGVLLSQLAENPITDMFYLTLSHGRPVQYRLKRFEGCVHVSGDRLFFVSAKSIVCTTVQASAKNQSVVMFPLTAQYGSIHGATYHEASQTMFWTDIEDRSGFFFVRINQYNFGTQTEKAGPAYFSIGRDYESLNLHYHEGHGFHIVTKSQLIGFNLDGFCTTRQILPDDLLTMPEFVRDECFVFHTADLYVVYNPVTRELQAEIETRRYVGSDKQNGRRYYVIEIKDTEPVRPGRGLRYKKPRPANRAIKK